MPYGRRTYGTYRKKTRYFKKSMGRKRVFPKTSLVNRNLKTNMQTVKCTYPETIYLGTGINKYLIETTINDYLNMSSILSGSPEFNSRVNQYSYYKINGISFTASRKWFDPISYGVDGVSKGFTASTFHLGLEECSLNFYPAYSSSAGIGSKVANAESSWKITPYVWDKQRHYIPFPSNFSNGSNSNGYGTWNSCSTYSSILGQLSIFNSGSCCSASTSGGIFLWDVEVEVYVTFCNSNGA